MLRHLVFLCALLMGLAVIQVPAAAIFVGKPRLREKVSNDQEANDLKTDATAWGGYGGGWGGRGHYGGGYGGGGHYGGGWGGQGGYNGGGWGGRGGGWGGGWGGRGGYWR